MGINNREKLVYSLWPDVGELLNLSRATTYRLANEGVIPTIRMGKKFLVPKVQLERLLNGQLQNQKKWDAKEALTAAHKQLRKFSSQLLAQPGKRRRKISQGGDLMGENLVREYRLRAGLSQTELARRIRVAPQNLSSIERGQLKAWPRIKKSLARALKVKESALFPEVFEPASQYQRQEAVLSKR